MPRQPLPSTRLGRLLSWAVSPAGLLLYLGVLLSFFAYWRMSAGTHHRLQTALESAADNRLAALKNAVRSYSDFLAGFELLFTYSDGVSLQEFEGAALAALADYPGLSGLEWARLVTPEELPALREDLRAMGLPPLELKQRRRDGSIVPLEPGEYNLPVIYAVPFEVHRAAYGLDLSGGPALAADVLRFFETSRMSMSTVTQLLVDEVTMGFVVYIPVYDPASPRRDPPGRRNLRGCLVGVFRLEDFFRHLAREPEPGILALEVRDATRERPQDLSLRVSVSGELAQLSDDHDPRVVPARWRDIVPPERTLALWERSWQVRFSPDYDWLDDQDAVRDKLLLALCLVASLAISRVMHGQRLRYALVEQAVRERTAELARNRATLDAIVDNNPNSIWCKDPTGRFILVNRVFCTLYGRGRDDLIGGTDRDIHPSAVVGDFETQDARVLTGEELPRFEGTYQINGREHTFLVVKFPLRDADGTPFAVAGIATDITALRRAETETLAIERKLLEAQKLESLGVMAGGIAHDFNNLLTGILGNAELALLGQPPDHPSQRRIHTIVATARRAADLCQQLLAYTGRGHFREEPVDLSELVKGTVSLLELSVSKLAHLSFDLMERPPRTLVDSTQVRQIVMNLVINASDALGAAAGEIRIRTGRQNVDHRMLASARLGAHEPEGDYVFVEITDTGGGMRPETLRRIFDPFFTTKFTGRGLGLAAVSGIVRGHHGILFVTSEVGKGSTFRLCLPISAAPPALLDETSLTPAPSSGTLCPGKLLVADDEPAVREFVRAILESDGLNSDLVNDGKAAVAAFDARPAAYQLVLLDLTMPGLSGHDVLRHIRARSSTQPILLMSGYSNVGLPADAAHDPYTGFLPKPFDATTLRHTITTLLTSLPK